MDPKELCESFVLYCHRMDVNIQDETPAANPSVVFNETFLKQNLMWFLSFLLPFTFFL